MNITLKSSSRSDGADGSQAPHPGRGGHPARVVGGLHLAGRGRVLRATLVLAPGGHVGAHRAPHLGVSVSEVFFWRVLHLGDVHFITSPTYEGGGVRLTGRH